MTFSIISRIIHPSDRKTITKHRTGGFEHDVSSGREQQPNVLSSWLFIHKQGFKPISRLDAHSVADDNILVFGADPHGGRRSKKTKSKKEIHIYE